MFKKPLMSKFYYILKTFKIFACKDLSSISLPTFLK